MWYSLRRGDALRDGERRLPAAADRGGIRVWDAREHVR